MYNLQKPNMLRSKTTPFEEDIEKATSESNTSEDWSLIMHICDNVVNYQDGSKFCFKAIMKRLHHNVPRVVMSALTVLDACVKNCDKRFLLQIASSDFTTDVRKLLTKMHPIAATNLKELLQRWSLNEFKDDPELCIIPALYYKLKSEGVEFPSVEGEKKPAVQVCTDPDAVTSQEEENDIIKALAISLKETGRYSPPNDHDSRSDFASNETKEPFKTRALYDFDAAEDNELTIKAGEIVLVSDSSNANWWKGSSHRGEGLFPANFVSVDLDAPIEDQKSVSFQEADNVTSEGDNSFVGEVQLDEKKIEQVLNWLNDIDPTEELPDSKEMLRLEDEVYQMVPLIEENLQNIDNSAAKLSAINVKIMDALDLFHSLSDNAISTTYMKYHSFSSMPVTGPQVALPTALPLQQPGTGMQSVVYVQAMPTSVAGPPNVKMTATPQSQVLQSTEQKSETLPQTNSSENVSVDEKDLPSSVVNNPAVQLPSNQPGPNVTAGGFYIQQPLPFPVPNSQQAAYIQAAGSSAMMNAIPAGGAPVQYIPLPYYIVNSSTPATMTQTNPQVVASSSQHTEVITMSQDSSIYSNTVSGAPSQTVMTYSNDLQQVAYSDPNSSNKTCAEVREHRSSSQNVMDLSDINITMQAG